jgi:hypothetical protein
MDREEKFRLLTDISHIIDNIYLSGFNAVKNKDLLKNIILKQLSE